MRTWSWTLWRRVEEAVGSSLALDQLGRALERAGARGARGGSPR